MSKIALVMSEGGVRCAYSVGAILALVEKYNLTQPDFVIGASGSTGTLAYFTAGQYESIKNIWENLLCTKNFISLARFWRIMDIDYLIDQIFKKQDPLNINAIKSSSVGLYIMLTDSETGESKYFAQTDIDIFEALRASNAMPVFFNKSVIINGRPFIDGALSFHLEDGIKLAKDLGAEKIIAINNKNESLKGILSYWIYAIFQKTKIRQAMLKNRPKFEHDKSVFLLNGCKKIPIGTLDNDQKRIKETIKLGYEDVANNQNLQEFLKNLPPKTKISYDFASGFRPLKT